MFSYIASVGGVELSQKAWYSSPCSVDQGFVSVCCFHSCYCLGLRAGVQHNCPVHIQRPSGPQRTDPQSQGEQFSQK